MARAGFEERGDDRPDQQCEGNHQQYREQFAAELHRGGLAPDEQGEHGGGHRGDDQDDASAERADPTGPAGRHGKRKQACADCGTKGHGPQTLLGGHEHKGVGRKGRCRSDADHSDQRLDTEPSVTGELAVRLVETGCGSDQDDRPQQGARQVPNLLLRFDVDDPSEDQACKNKYDAADGESCDAARQGGASRCLSLKAPHAETDKGGEDRDPDDDGANGVCASAVTVVEVQNACDRSDDTYAGDDCSNDVLRARTLEVQFGNGVGQKPKTGQRADAVNEVP